MASNYALKYNVDIVFCVDATGSMRPVIDQVKQGILNFHGDLANAMEAKGKHIDGLRIRVVAFRDYLYDNEEAMLVTDFFNLPAQAADLTRCIQSITPKGGGDEPEDSLEALAYAIRSDWLKTESMMKRQVIVLWTDATPHELGFAKSSPLYPSGMPKSLEELSSWWGSDNMVGYMDDRAKRLLLFAPEDTVWDQISRSWNNTIYFPSIAGEGLREYEYKQIIDVISNSI